ncbi:MAG: PASTA domain-containing protein [Ruminococcaceae bacterium]|nr:PASTA domain-containing protein [Oscillospiraceae bacterium]
MKELPPKNQEEMSDLHPKLFARSRVLFVLAVLLFGGLLVRILLLQTLGYDRYQQKVIDQMTTESSVTAKRGNIYDANGVLLATNISTFRVFISPSSIADAQAEANKNGETVDFAALIAENLSSILNVDSAFVQKQTTYTKYLDRTIKKEVDEATADSVRAFIDQYGLQRMVYLQATDTRYYPYGSLASHVLGFTGSDGTGLYGLEYQYNSMLAGTNGRYITARDAQGNEMPYSHKEYIEAEPGYHVNTTLDFYVQAALEEQLETAYIESNGQNRAAGVVMNVNTGAILGMAVYPSFDLNDPWTLDYQSLVKLLDSGYASDSEEYATYKQALLLNMWSNKAVTESYIPGSTFKVITAAMALEEKVVQQTESYTCVGSFVVSNRKIHCHKTTGHGTLTFEQGIQQSCNPWLMRVGLRLGTTRFYSYLRSFGYLERTGVDLPGEGVSVFAAEADFTELDLAIYAFGQNFNVTLMQQITAVAAVANGGYLVQPHLVSSITDTDGNVIKSYDTSVRRQVVSSAVCEEVAKILEEGVSGDGGAKNAYVTGYRVAAKTGTSEKKEFECPRCDSAAELKTVDGEQKFVCSLCKYTGSSDEFEKSEDYVCSTVAFAPADNPQYAVIIIVDEPTSGLLYGSTVAAPYVGNVMETILPYLGVEAIYTDAELQKMTVKIPDCLYWSAEVAQNYCEKNYGLTVEIIGDPDGVVYKQSPAAGSVVEKSDGRIVLYTERKAEEEVCRVPDVTGMSAVAANAAIVNAGFNIRILGTKNYFSGTGATAVKQSVAPGTELPRGSVIEVTFRYLSDEDMGHVEE